MPLEIHLFQEVAKLLTDSFRCVPGEGSRDQPLGLPHLATFKRQRGGTTQENGSGGLEVQLLSYERRRLAFRLERQSEQPGGIGSSVLMESGKQRLIDQLHCLFVEVAGLVHFVVTLDRGVPNSTTMTIAGVPATLGFAKRST